MGLVLLPRIAAAIVRGATTQHSYAPGYIFGPLPHVYKARAGLLDIDVMSHMNNAAYLTHCELARWQLCAETGLLSWCVRKKAGFVVAHVNMRYRREVSAFQPFEIHTRIAAADASSVYMSHDFHPPGGGTMLAQCRVRALLKQGRATIDPRQFLEAAGVDAPQIEAVLAPEAIGPDFRAANALEGALREAAAEKR